MSVRRSSDISPAIDEDSTPKPASAVVPSCALERSSASSRQGVERRAALIDYFASPPAEMLEMDAAWEEAVALYGDEDSDAWVAALEDGTHPLCRVRKPQRSA